MQFWRDSTSLCSNAYKVSHLQLSFEKQHLVPLDLPTNFPAHFQEVITLHLLQNCMHYFQLHDKCWGLYSAIYFQRLFFVLVPVVTACLLSPVMPGIWVDWVALPVTRCLFKTALQNVKYSNLKRHLIVRVRLTFSQQRLWRILSSGRWHHAV
jgi:hypothetical protein